MIEKHDEPIWAFLFQEPHVQEKRLRQRHRQQVVAPWYQKQSGHWKSLSWPLPACNEAPWEMRQYVALDVETTGLIARRDRIVEVAAVQFFFDSEGALSIGREFSHLINPECEISERVSRIHGITQHDIQGAPHFDAIAPLLLDFCKGRVPVGHNVLFDIAFLERELHQNNCESPFWECADTLGLAKLAFPSMDSYNLGKLTFVLELEPEVQHRALGDARACARLFAACMRSLTSQC